MKVLACLKQAKLWHSFPHNYINTATMTKPDNSPEIKTDLRHDTMEFAASTDGDDQLDTDDEDYEEEDISVDELDALEDDDAGAQAAALSAEESDHLTDEDTLPEEDWTDDLPDIASDEEEDDEEHRK